MAREVKGMRAINAAKRRQIRESLINQYGPYCQICLENGTPQHAAVIDMESRREPRSFSIDHIVALADGGSNTRNNMQPSHQRCNERKGSEHANALAGKPRRRQNVTHVTGVRLAYSSSSN